MGLLPTEMTLPKTSLSDLTILVYGPTKIGKTTFVAQFPNTIFLATEEGLNAQKVFKTPIKSWLDLINVGGELASGNHQFKTVAIDTIDIAYKLCSQYILEKMGKPHESDLAYGKGWDMVNREFSRVINLFAGLPYGLVLISHSKMREIETRNAKVTKVQPAVGKEGVNIVLALADIVLYTDFNFEGHRVIRTKSSGYYEAGDRYDILPDPINLSFPEFYQHWKNGIYQKFGIDIDINNALNQQQRFDLPKVGETFTTVGDQIAILDALAKTKEAASINQLARKLDQQEQQNNTNTDKQ